LRFGKISTPGTIIVNSTYHGNYSIWSIQARWVFPVNEPPLPWGRITIQNERILSVNSQPRGAADIVIDDCAIIPGLVNAHTHLDLSGLRGTQAQPGEDFTQWLRSIIRHRRTLSTDQLARDIQTGIHESLACGTTMIGDISANGLSWPILTKAPLWSVVYYELLGLPRSRGGQVWQQARAWWDTRPETATCRAGFSPHSPYGAGAALFRTVADFVGGSRTPVAIHLAETREEMQLLRNHLGPFVDFLNELGVWEEEELISNPADLISLFSENAITSFVHANYLDPGNVPSGMASIIFCPRTHAAFGHAPHPWREFLAKGVNVALGTDSPASNPDLNVLAEARFLHERHPEFSGAELLRMATLAGARAMGWDDQAGSLAPQKSADLVVLPVGLRPVEDPHLLLWDSAGPVRAVLCRGNWVIGEMR
jgi:cytosine/adenosine deaminase-related metal-dependent hydrolase